MVLSIARTGVTVATGLTNDCSSSDFLASPVKMATDVATATTTILVSGKGRTPLVTLAGTP